MFKKLFSLLLILSMLLTSAAVAEDSGEALTLTELTEWAQSYKTRALTAGAPLNNPAEEAARSEDGYAFIYDFATLYMDRPEMTAESVLQAVVITSPEEKGPHGTLIDDLSSDVIAAYYNENPSLVGDRSFAALYLSSMLPDDAQWGWVQRDGQRIMAVQYAIHESVEGGYTDCGVLYTIQDNLVSAIRAYGLAAVISEDEVRDNLEAVEQVMGESTYSQVKTSVNGAELETFGRDDLIFAGVDYLTLTPEEAADTLGECREDNWMQDDTGDYLRTMEFGACSMTFLYDANKQNPVLSVLTIDTDLIEGPRAVRIGDTLSSVISRFRSGEGEYDGVSREVLYGDGVNAPYGLAEYGDDVTATLWYALKADDGRVIALCMSFEQMNLSEVTLYTDD